MENGNKYCCVGAQPGRAERGVQSGLYRLKYGFLSNIRSAKQDDIYGASNIVLPWVIRSFFIL
jgi:hypothetical protein